MNDKVWLSIGWREVGRLEREVCRLERERELSGDKIKERCLDLPTTDAR